MSLGPDHSDEQNATASEWVFNGTQVGEWTVSRNLTYAKVSRSK
jgi:hypothetical protein